jgi:thioredoxin-like negative regulator of GroEL
MNDTTAKPAVLADESELDAFLDDHDRALVEFYTEGCGICASMEPVLGIVARETDTAVALVNPRDDPVLVERFDVRSVPTLVLFEDGEQVGRVADGFLGADEVLAFVDDETASGSD